MILFFGTRPGKTYTIPLSAVRCRYCEQLDTFTIFKTYSWFHIFWIKLFKISSKTIAECSHCKRVYAEHEFTDDIKQALITAQMDN